MTKLKRRLENLSLGNIKKVAEIYDKFYDKTMNFISNLKTNDKLPDVTDFYAKINKQINITGVGAGPVVNFVPEYEQKNHLQNALNQLVTHFSSTKHNMKTYEIYSKFDSLRISNPDILKAKQLVIKDNCTETEKQAKFTCKLNIFNLLLPLLELNNDN